MKNSVAIITARGGSKRIPGKNIRDFLGKPIIVYSIEAALASGVFSEVMVSTDDQAIAEISKKAGAKVPFMRSDENASDFATTAEVLVEVLDRYAASGKRFETACCIYATAPFVSGSTLKKAYDLLTSQQAFSVIPVCKFSFPIWRSFRIEQGRLAYQWPENALKRSQDLPAAYHDCGQFYFFNVERFLAEKKLVSDQTLPLEMPEREVQDIDTEEDWELAEFKFKSLQIK